MNTIFERNIEALKQKNGVLAKKLLTHLVDDIPQLVKQANSYNLSYKNILLHNQENPLAEAMEIFHSTPNTPVTIHLVFGIGLGYLFQYTAQNSEGTVILYEQDLNIIRIAFSIVDFSNEISKSNVYITDNQEDLGNYIHQKSNTLNSPYLISTKGYQELRKDDFDETVRALETMIGTFTLDRKYTQEKFYPLLLNTLNASTNFLRETPLAAIKNRFVDKTAVIVSAGPSLDKNIETIKKYRENIILIVVGTAAKTLHKNGITPDFISIIEAYDNSKQLEGIDTKNINFITEPYSNLNLHKINFKNTFLHVSANMPINSVWKHIYEEDISEYITKGTVSYTSLNSARILGCSKIILVGQDLAYTSGQCYSKDSAYKDLSCEFNKENNKWEITAKDFKAFANALSNSPNKTTREDTAKRRIKNLNNSLYYVKGINGEMLPTESVYAAFIPPLTEFTKTYNDREYINASMIGAQIDGFKNLPLEEALKDSPIIEDREINTNFEYKMDKIIGNLKNELEILNKNLQLIATGKDLIRKFNNETRRTKELSVEILKSLKKVSEQYLAISYNNNNENNIFEIISIADRIDLDLEMKLVKKLTTEIAVNIVNKISNYYNNCEARINQVKMIINNIIEAYNEISNTKS